MTDKRRTPGAIARFFSVLTDSLWELVQLNFIFLLTSLPLVTFGAALTALDSCFLDILQKKRRDEPILPRYFAAFRAALLPSLPWGLILLAGILILSFSLLWYGSLAMEGWIFIPFTALSLLGLIFFSGILSHLFLLLAGKQKEESAAAEEKGQEEPPLLKKAALQALTRMGPTLAGLFAAFILLALQFLLFPATVPLTLSLGLSIPALVMARACLGEQETQ